jgi:hypothetical protein
MKSNEALNLTEKFHKRVIEKIQVSRVKINYKDTSIKEYEKLLKQALFKKKYPHYAPEKRREKSRNKYHNDRRN